MLDLLKKSLDFVDPATRVQAGGLIVLMILGALLEVVGIGLVFPLVKAISEPAILSQYQWAMPILGQITPENQSSVLILIAAGFLGVIVFKNAFLLLVYFVQGRFFTKNEALLAHKMFAHYLRGDYRLHLTRNSATLINNVTSTVSAVYSHTLRGFMTIGIEIFLIAILALVLLAADPLLTIGALVMVSFAIAIFYGAIKKRLNIWGKQATVSRQQIIKILQQGFHSIKEVKVLGREDFILHGFDVHREEYAITEARIFIASNAPRLWIETVVITCAMFGVIYIVNQGGHSSGLFSVLALFAAAAFRLIPSMNRILIAMNSIRGGSYPVNILHDDLQTFQPAFQPPDGQNVEKLPFKETLVLDNVSFTYPEADVTAVSNISLTINKGQSVGFVGPSGGGKTTLVDIILGLLPPESGKILVDGTDVSGNMTAWQTNLSYVPQSVYLMDDTLRHNIAFGLRDEEISDDMLRNAVRLAQLEDLVRDLPDGLETNVGEQGVRLSGGQLQRVGIARALYHDPEILILDEATSSLDSKTEREINKAIERLSGNKTVIIIAHRLSTVRKCDRLVFLEDGRIADSGTFEDLKAGNDTFRNLVELSKL